LLHPRCAIFWVEHRGATRAERSTSIRLVRRGIFSCQFVDRDWRAQGEHGMKFGLSIFRRPRKIWAALVGFVAIACGVPASAAGIDLACSFPSPGAPGGMGTNQWLLDLDARTITMRTIMLPNGQVQPYNVTWRLTRITDQTIEWNTTDGHVTLDRSSLIMIATSANGSSTQHCIKLARQI
jgi:hypothetical protein